MNFTRLLNDLKRYEGLRLKPYKDSVGKLTIGYGRNLDAKGISKNEAENMLQNDVFAALQDAYSMFSSFHSHSIVRQEVIVGMIFNLGKKGFLSFTKMIAAFNEREYELTADEMLDSKWARQVGQRAIELAGRMRTGEYGD